MNVRGASRRRVKTDKKKRIERPNTQQAKTVYERIGVYDRQQKAEENENTERSLVCYDDKSKKRSGKRNTRDIHESISSNVQQSSPMQVLTHPFR